MTTSKRKDQVLGNLPFITKALRKSLMLYGFWGSSIYLDIIIGFVYFLEHPEQTVVSRKKQIEIHKELLRNAKRIKSRKK